MNTAAHNKGFTLIECLVAFMVLTLGLLGIVGLQVQAKQASYVSLQRSAALYLANDVIGRISVNGKPSALNAYNVKLSSTDPLNSSPSCLTKPCDANQLVAFDIEEWKKLIKAQDRTGALANAHLCINPSMMSDNEINLQVIVSWQGREKLKSSDHNQTLICGEQNDKRRVFALNRYILLGE
jgi:type IV pilus assembly protein PilV